LGYAKRIDFDEEVPLFVGLGLIKLRKNLVDPKYVEYYMNTPYISGLSTEKANGTGRMTLPLEETRQFPFPLAPIAEQRRIVAKIEELFSELDASAESLTRARAQLKTYRQALLKAAFEGKLTADWREANRESLQTAQVLKTRVLSEKSASSNSQPATPVGTLSLAETTPGWAWCSLDMVVSENLIGLVRSSAQQNVIGEGVSYIKMDRVDMEGRVATSAEVFVSAGPAEIKRYSLRRGDILFNTRNSLELVGKVGLVKSEPVMSTIFNNNLMRIRTIPSVRPEFLAYQMCGHNFRERMERVKKATTSVAAVYGKDLWPIPICVPDVREQLKIVETLDKETSAIDTMIADIDLNLYKIGALIQSILKKAFSGRLVPQDPSDEPAAALLARLPEDAPAARKTRRKLPA
jgi:type I restriction enzyme S subunit